MRVANLGTWGRWVPAGWRLTGELHASASIGGRFGAPEYTGRIEGTHLGVRNFLQGVNVKEGSVAIALHGSSARIEKFTARGGSGSVSLEGEASFDEAPAARLKLDRRPLRDARPRRPAHRHQRQRLAPARRDDARARRPLRRRRRPGGLQPLGCAQPRRRRRGDPPADRRAGRGDGAAARHRPPRRRRRRRRRRCRRARARSISTCGWRWARSSGSAAAASMPGCAASCTSPRRAAG